MAALTKIGHAVHLCVPGFFASALLLSARWLTMRILAMCFSKRQQHIGCSESPTSSATVVDPLWVSCGLSAEDVERYGRQIILPKLGVAGQQALLEARVLVIGAGGLGCPVALYLCAAGIGHIGIVDDDTVAISNLHRQIGHSCQGVGESKALSLRRACHAINSTTDIQVHVQRLSDLLVARDLFSGYDALIDCTDAPSSRYLINDAAVHARRPLIAASSVGLCGQLTVYNWEGGPCLRCAFPDIPGASGTDMVASCAESGVLGPIPGVLGTLAAVETTKLVAGGALAKSCLNGKMLLYDAADAQPFRYTKIRKRDSCETCSQPGSVERCAQTVVQPCGCLASTSFEVAATEIARRLRQGEQMLVLDVRQKTHFVVSHIAIAKNWPLPDILRSCNEKLRSQVEEMSVALGTSFIVCVCRRGNDSSLATDRLRQAGLEAWNLKGGLQVLANEVGSPFKAPPLT